ncbi:GIY-YIG nuclease family protein [Virgibacillus sp. 6R]|uniref:GIY-YIG nuclease family protein n=1 Tax=Metabacillus niabensis TaxID=324854 RepID=UPI00164358D8
MDSNSGAVYVLTNQYMPNIVKIGSTKTLVSKRVKTINNHEGLPAPFNIEYEIETRYPSHAELLCHAILHDYRIDIMREFFCVELNAIKKVLKETIEKIDYDSQYYINLYPNSGKPWDLETTSLLVEKYKANLSINELSNQFKKTPIEIDRFLNYIGLRKTTKFVNSIPHFAGIPRNCYKTGEFVDVRTYKVPKEWKNKTEISMVKNSKKDNKLTKKKQKKYEETKSYSVEEIRKEFKNAYKPWTPEEESILKSYFSQGLSFEDIAQNMHRKVGGIRSRLIKLKLIEK